MSRGHHKALHWLVLIIIKNGLIKIPLFLRSYSQVTDSEQQQHIQNLRISGLGGTSEVRGHPAPPCPLGIGSCHIGLKEAEEGREQAVCH